MNGGFAVIDDSFFGVFSVEEDETKFGNIILLICLYIVYSMDTFILFFLNIKMMNIPYASANIGGGG